MLGARWSGIFDLASGYAVSLGFAFAILLLLYRFVPYVAPAWREAILSATFGALVLELGKTLFSVYTNRVANFEAVYGSVSSIIALLLWLYFAARVILVGAELIAVRREGSELPREPTSS